MANVEGDQPQVLSASDGVDELVASAAESNDHSALLEMPDGVANLIVCFVASGVGGLRNVFSFRTACSTTQSWVDNLPKAQANVVFSKAHVTMDYDMQSVRRFTSCPPRYGVSALSLQVKTPAVRFQEMEALTTDEEWSAFCAFWKPKLESLQLQLQLRTDAPYSYKRPVKISRRLLALLDSTKIARLHLSEVIVDENAPLPSCLRTLQELRVGFTHKRCWPCSPPADRNPLYAQLEENENLRDFHVNVDGGEDFLRLAQFVDSKKENSRLQFKINLRYSLLWIFHDEFRNFAVSVIASKSTVRLELNDLNDFVRLTSGMFPRAAVAALLAKVESVKVYTPQEEWYSLRENLPLLKTLKMVRTRTEETRFDLRQLTFPPALEFLGFNVGFPPIGHLPLSLTSLKLLSITCDAGSLARSLNLLGGRCSNLETLEFQWEVPVEGGVANLEMEAQPGGFPNLKRLRVSAGMRTGREEQMAVLRVGLLNAFDWQRLRLELLQLSLFGFYASDNAACSGADEEILRQICEGPSGHSLLTLNVDEFAVTPETVPWLEKLKTMAAANWERREKAEGRGGWQQFYKQMKVE